MSKMDKILNGTWGEWGDCVGWEEHLEYISDEIDGWVNDLMWRLSLVGWRAMFVYLPGRRNREIYNAHRTLMSHKEAVNFWDENDGSEWGIHDVGRNKVEQRIEIYSYVEYAHHYNKIKYWWMPRIDPHGWMKEETK